MPRGREALFSMKEMFQVKGLWFLPKPPSPYALWISGTFAHFLLLFLSHGTSSFLFWFFFLAALAIWYLMHGSPVCKLSLVQSSAEKEEKKNSLLWPWTFDDLVSVPVKLPVVFLKSRTCPGCPLANLRGTRTPARAVTPPDGLSPARLD